jgi:hypothetical protein
MLLGCGRRRPDATALAMGHVGWREGWRCIVDGARAAARAVYRCSRSKAIPSPIPS